MKWGWAYVGRGAGLWTLKVKWQLLTHNFHLLTWICWFCWVFILRAPSWSCGHLFIFQSGPLVEHRNICGLSLVLSTVKAGSKVQKQAWGILNGIGKYPQVPTIRRVSLQQRSTAFRCVSSRESKSETFLYSSFYSYCVVCSSSQIVFTVQHFTSFLKPRNPTQIFRKYIYIYSILYLSDWHPQDRVFLSNELVQVL